MNFLNEYDKIIIQTMSLIAEQHKCHLTNVDISVDENGQRVGLIEIAGPEEKKVALSQAIDEALKKFKT